jgi:hypothetical protein
MLAITATTATGFIILIWARIKRSHPALSNYLKSMAVEFDFFCGGGRRRGC